MKIEILIMNLKFVNIIINLMKSMRYMSGVYYLHCGNSKVRKNVMMALTPPPPKKHSHSVSIQSALSPDQPKCGKC